MTQDEPIFTLEPDYRRRALNVARHAVTAYAGRHPEVVGAFIVGSVARGDASPHSDVDLRILLDAEPLPSAFFVVDEGIPLEWKCLAPSRYADLDEVLRHPFRATELAESVILLDTSDRLHSLRRAILPVYAQEEFRRIRSQRLMRDAWQTFDAAETRWRETGKLSLWEFRCAVFWGAEACLVAENLPPSHRRLLPRLREAVSRRNDPFLYDGLCNVLNAAQLPLSEIELLWERVFALLGGLPEGVASGHPYLDRRRIPYWRQGIAELLTTDGFQDSSFPMWSLLALMWGQSSAESPVRSECATMLERLGFDRPRGVQRGMRAVKEWLMRLSQDLTADIPSCIV